MYVATRTREKHKAQAISLVVGFLLIVTSFVTSSGRVG